jgi:hypothetical protein
MRLVVRSASPKPEGGKIMHNEKPYRTPYKNPIGGIAVGILIICLAVAIYLGVLNWTWFLTILFVGLALCALVGGFSSYDPKAAYGGLQGFVWLLGLALCFATSFWPWILLPLGVSIILGALAVPIMESMRRSVYPPANPQYPPPYQPGQPYQPYQPGQPWPPYQQGQPYQPYQQAQPGQPMTSQPVQPGQTSQPVEQSQEQAPVASQESEPQPVQQP